MTTQLDGMLRRGVGIAMAACITIAMSGCTESAKSSDYEVGIARWEAQEKARIEKKMTLKDNIGNSAHDDLVGAAKDKADKGKWVKGKFLRAFKREDICKNSTGGPIPYDHSRGMVEEYSFELAMSCDFGGYVMPMIEADPENLSEVQKYNDALTEWFRVHILGCGDANPKVSSADFLLLPVAQQADMSAGDFDGSVDLFFSIMKRHDGLADGFSAGQKAEIKKRLELYRKGAVKKNSSEKTKPSPMPDCVPASDGA